MAWRSAQKKSIRSFVGSELSFLKLGSVLAGLMLGVLNFSCKPLALCVCGCGQIEGGALERVHNFHFI